MEIREADGIVKIDEFELYGHIEQGKYCSECKFELVYYDKFDTYFCPACNRWTESRCSDPDCNYCLNRPEKPLSLK